ncbi:MAG: hypothetical protein M3441_25200, partial [Chloroflexota bacterium]|nr:hypothetical protein [Chloroflexota bacterium]
TALISVSWLYFTGLFAWATSHVLFGDRWWWLFLVNSFAVYLFLPLPAVLTVAIIARRREIWTGFGAALALY